MSTLRSQIELMFNDQNITRDEISNKVLEMFENHEHIEIRKEILKTFAECAHDLLNQAALEFDDKSTSPNIIANFARLYRDLHNLYVTMFSERNYDIVLRITEFRLQKDLI